MRCEQLESESQESKDALDECKEAFNKKDTENEKETRPYEGAKTFLKRIHKETSQ